MPDPNSSHVSSTPAVAGNNYDACSSAPVSTWKKARTVGVQTGHGWKMADDIADAEGAGWHQT